MNSSEQRPTEILLEGTPRLMAIAQAVGETVMPEKIKEMYFISKRSEQLGDQLVIPRWADPMDTRAVELPSN